VSERERGVWRPYRLTPAATGTLVAGTLAARYVVLMSALAAQLLLGMVIGQWAPAHAVDLWIATSLAAFALLGFGLVLAALADTVTAAQALGQSIFLPMLIVGGVAVRPDMLPDWILPVTAFLPGRYAVETIQASVDGGGLGALRFHVAALATIGTAGAVAGTKLFRWDSGQRFLRLPHKAWALVAIASWIGIGAIAVQRGELTPRRTADAPRGTSLLTGVASPAAPLAGDAAVPSAESDSAPGGTPAVGPPPASPGDGATEARPHGPAGATTERATAGAAAGPNGTTPAAATPPSATSATTAATEPWRALTEFDFAALPLADMPPDAGNISPIADEGEAPAGSTVGELRRVVDALPGWAPGHVADRVERVRNYLLILAVADFAQSPLERFLPGALVTHLLTEFPRQELAQLLCWVTLRSDEGTLSALDDPLLVGLGAATLDRGELRTRTYYYGVKLTRRVVGY
jgi:hypothetical protein